MEESNGRQREERKNLGEGEEIRGKLKGKMEMCVGGRRGR